MNDYGTIPAGVNTGTGRVRELTVLTFLDKIEDSLMQLSDGIQTLNDRLSSISIPKPLNEIASDKQPDKYPQVIERLNKILLNVRRSRDRIGQIMEDLEI